MPFKALNPVLLLFLFTGIFLLTGCFEIVEDITLHKNGSGTFFYTINLSQSKTRLDGILKLDSTDGYRVPKRKEIDENILKTKATLEKSPGITNVIIGSDWVNYIFTLKFDFNSVNNLNLAVETVSAELASDHKRIPEAADNFAFTGKIFDRKSHYNAKVQSPKLTAQDKEILKDASYTCIFRFDEMVSVNSNKDTKISKSGKSVMLKLNMLQLATGQKSIVNKVILK
ncbi:MAG: hypothetical protein M3R17_10140 [Bacteroidota bacterium]|nr:hypothetical protein [Bacteroidota bacterium]